MTDPAKLKHGGHCDIPMAVATCPECGGALYAECQDWEEETGLPIYGSINVDCIIDADAMDHRYWQSDWQSVVDAVGRWAGAVEN